MENTKDQKYQKWFYITAVILIVVFILALQQSCEHKTSLAEQTEMYNSMSDSVTFYKNKNGTSGATVSTIQTSNPEDFINAASKDSTIIKLQALVKKYKKELSKQGSAVIINTEGQINAVATTTVTDSTTNSQGVKSPVYEANFALKNTKETDSIKANKIWVWGKTIATVENTTVQLKYTDELSLVIGVEKTGFLGLGKGKLFSNITSANPFSTVKDLKVYDTGPYKIKKIGIGPNITYGIGSNFTPQIVVGIGVQYNLIRL